MLESNDLTGDEMQWLLAISRGPLSRASVERRVPGSVRDGLLGKGFARWKLDFFQITTEGEATVARRRAARAIAS